MPIGPQLYRLKHAWLLGFQAAGTSRTRINTGCDTYLHRCFYFPSRTRVPIGEEGCLISNLIKSSIHAPSRIFTSNSAPAAPNIHAPPNVNGNFLFYSHPVSMRLPGTFSIFTFSFPGTRILKLICRSNLFLCWSGFQGGDIKCRISPAQISFFAAAIHAGPYLKHKLLATCNYPLMVSRLLHIFY